MILFEIFTMIVYCFSNKKNINYKKPHAASSEIPQMGKIKLKMLGLFLLRVGFGEREGNAIRRGISCVNLTEPSSKWNILKVPCIWV